MGLCSSMMLILLLCYTSTFLDTNVVISLISVLLLNFTRLPDSISSPDEVPISGGLFSFPLVCFPAAKSGGERRGEGGLSALHGCPSIPLGVLSIFLISFQIFYTLSTKHTRPAISFPRGKEGQLPQKQKAQAFTPGLVCTLS